MNTRNFFSYRSNRARRIIIVYFIDCRHEKRKEKEKSVSVFDFRLPFPPYVLFANRDPFLHRAILTLHEAAPVKFALAPLRSTLSYHVVAPAAAQTGASVTAGAGLVAPATGGAGDIGRRVPFAKVGRFLIVEELLSEIPGFPPAAVAMLPLPLSIGPPPTRSSNSDRRRHAAQIALCHQHGAPETFLQSLADHPEVRCDPPAGLQFARAGHAVALAAHLHVARYCLQYLFVRRF